MVSAGIFIRTPGRCRAFSLIELLVVVAIMAMLVALTVAASSAFRGKAKVTRTRTAIAILHQALSLRLVEGKAEVSPVEHPLAGSREPRPPFRRLADGSAVAAEGTAFTGLDRLDAVAAAFRGRVLLADDLAADPDRPGIYGLRRSDLRILGAPMADVTAARRLADPGPGRSLADPERSGRLLPTTADAQAAAKAFVHILEPALAQELVDLGCLGEAEPAFDRPLAGGTVVGDGKALPTWRPGAIRDAGVWTAYRLRGMHLRDAWGREILVGGERSLRIESAGPDGVFAWNPGPNGRIDAAIGAVAARMRGAAWGSADAVGDDVPGDGDNIGGTAGD